MAIQQEFTIQRFRGSSHDQKPGAQRAGEAFQAARPPVGSVFTEIDTGARYIWTIDKEWVRQDQTIEALFAELIDTINTSNEQVIERLDVLVAGQAEHLLQYGVEL